MPSVWVATAFILAIFSSWSGSSNQSIWLAKVEPGVQGRVFASRYLIAQITTPLGLRIAGPLADYVFEPVMRTGNRFAEILGAVFGTGFGAGMALQLTLFSLGGVFIGLCGYAFPSLRNAEDIVPDYDPTALIKDS